VTQEKARPPSQGNYNGKAIQYLSKMIDRKNVGEMLTDFVNGFPEEYRAEALSNCRTYFKRSNRGSN
jgi:hypothetical protein